MKDKDSQFQQDLIGESGTHAGGVDAPSLTSQASPYSEQVETMTQPAQSGPAADAATAVAAEEATAEVVADVLTEVTPEVTPEVDADADSGTTSVLSYLTAFELPGQVLAARREELRWSLEEAALRLKLTPRQVSALEADDFASLPGMASVRGFVRSYAKMLGVDPQPLLEMLASEPNPAHAPMVLRRPLPSNGFPGRRSSPPPRRSKWGRRLLIGAAVVVAIAAAGIEAQRSQWLPIPQLPALPSIAEMPSLSLLNGVSFDVRLPRFGTDSLAAQGTHEQAPADTAAAEGETQTAQGAAHQPALELKIREDAWVEITTLNGEKIVSRLMRAGTSESFDIAEPVVLVVGNASAVDARLRGQALNLKAVARDNVSKLSLK